MSEIVDGGFVQNYSIERDLKDKLEEVLYGEFEGKISAVAAIGVLHLLITDVTEQTLE